MIYILTLFADQAALIVTREKGHAESLNQPVGAGIDKYSKLK
ncbi:hypothetical protein [Bacillus sp. REN3]|nr:hypothetical protein [Bacillus sp. REN3]